MDSAEKLLASLAAPGRWVSATTAGLTLLGFVIIFCTYRSKTKRSSNPELPPGPSPWPIVGNLHMLGELPHRALKDLADSHGLIMFLRFGSVPAVVASSPDIAKHFLKTHDLLFASRPESARGKYLFYNFKDLAFAPYGDYWRQMRKICVLKLRTARRIEYFQSVRDEDVSAMIREKGAKPVNVSKALSSLTANIICRMVMGRTFTSTDAPGGTDAEGGVFSRCFRYWRFRSLSWLFGSAGHTLAEEIIDEHMNQNWPENNDFVDVLLDISERGNMVSRNDMKGLLLDVLVGGTDTSGATLEWAMLETLRNPAVMKTMQEELDSVVGKDGRENSCDLSSLQYLQCVVKETLRLHSPRVIGSVHCGGIQHSCKNEGYCERVGCR